MRDDLPPGTDPAEVRELEAVARRLQAERPVPNPAFRGALGRHLAERGDRPSVALLPARRAQALSACYSLAGLLLLAVAAAGLAGAGPFASS